MTEIAAISAPVRFRDNSGTRDPPVATVQLLKNGVEIFPAMLDAIRGAERCVALEMYIFSTDETGRTFRTALEGAARRGVIVEVLLDSLGCWKISDSFWKALREAGGKVRWFRPIRRGILPFRDHRKMLLVDDHIAFVAGLNVGDEYVTGKGSDPPWRDNAFRIEGTEVNLLRRSFGRMWNRADRPLRIRDFQVARVHPKYVMGMIGGGGVRFLESGPEGPVRAVRRAYGRLIGQAVSQIDLAMGYFFPPGRILRSLRRAVRRGVKVRLLVPAKTDVAVVGWAVRGIYGKLLRFGIEIWEYQPSMLHAKLAVVDDVVVTGSANLDLRSSRLNYELVAAVSDRDIANQAREDFEEDLSRSVQVSMADWRRRPLVQRIKERISYWLLARADLFLSRSRLVRSRW